MGSIGDNFPYAAPVIGSTNWANWILCMDEIIDRVSSPVPFSAFNGTDLDMDGNSITNVKGIEFQNHTDAVANTPGLIRYYNNEWYLVTAAGVVQVTDGGVLNAANLGGFGGDYGGANPAKARFTDATHRYDFYDDYSASEWAYVRTRGVDINNGVAGTNFCRLNYGTAADITLTLPTSLPGANRSIFTVTSGGQLNPNTASNTITNHVYLGNVEVKHTYERSICHTFNPDTVSSGVWSAITVGSGVTATVAGTSFYRLNGIQVGWRIKAVKLTTFKNGGANSTVALQQYNAGSFVSLLATQSDAVVGQRTITATVGTPVATIDADQYVVQVVAGNNGDDVYSVTVTYDIP